MKKYRKSGKQVRKNEKFGTEHKSFKIYQKKYKFVNQGNQCVIHNNPYRVFLAYPSKDENLLWTKLEKRVK